MYSMAGLQTGSLGRTLPLGRAGLRATRSYGLARLAVVTKATGAEMAAGGEGGQREVFPRLRERDPYKRMGISKEASTEEIQDARNYLVTNYQWHEKSRESIESAYDQIINEKLRERKKAGKLGAKSEKKAPSSQLTWADRLSEKIEKPPLKIVMQRAFVFAVLGVWSVMLSAATGPAFQVALGFGLSIYFLNLKRGQKNLLGAAGASFGALFLGWLVGTIVPVYIPIFPVSWSPETICALFSFVSLWGCCTFLR